MIIYVNGDSYVAGDGLAHDILEGIHKDNFDNLTSEQRHKLHDQNHRLLANPRNIELMPQLRALEKEKRFSTLIEKQLGFKVINSAWGGSSFDRITRTSIIDLIELKKSTDEKIVAIIGETAPTRIEVPRYDEKSSLSDAIPWYDLHIGIEPMKDSKNYMFWMNRFMVAVAKDYHLYTKYFLNWILLQEFCKNNDIELHWCQVWGYKPDVSKYKDLETLYEQANIEPSVSMLDLSFKAKIRIAPDGGHFSPEVHELVADEFVKILKKHQE